MEVILLEKYRKLGNIGDVVDVKNGYARNYLIPQNKALRATNANKEVFEAKKAEIKKEFDTKVRAASSIQQALQNKHVLIIKQASEDDRLYGSVSSNEIVKAIKEQLSQDVLRSAVDMNIQIKYLGVYDVSLNLFADVSVIMKLIVARSKEEEAKFLVELKGENKKSKAPRNDQEKAEAAAQEAVVQAEAEADSEK